MMNERAQGRQWGSLGIIAFVCLAIGFLGSRITMEAIPNWYASLQKPLGTPPSLVFAPVWTLLYILMSIAAWRVWRLRDRIPVKRELLMFFIQLGLNALWTPAFFGLRNTGLGLFVILGLCRAVYGTQKAFQKIDPPAGLLMFPYLVWVVYAAYLNAGIWWLNR